MKKIFIVAVLSCLLGVFAIPGYASVYKYTDKNGILCFSDSLQSVPEEYRAEAVIVEGEMKDEDATISANSQPAAIEQPLATEPASEPQKKRTRPLSFRLMISATIGLCSVLLFIFVSKQPRLKENEKVLSGIRGALIAVVSLYLVITHVRDVMTVFGFVGKAIDDAQQQSAEKGRKAAEAMKKLDALFEDAQKAGEKLQADSANGDDK